MKKAPRSSTVVDEVPDDLADAAGAAHAQVSCRYRLAIA
jgi:hypothetical protein